MRNEEASERYEAGTAHGSALLVRPPSFPDLQRGSPDMAGPHVPLSLRDGSAVDLGQHVLNGPWAGHASVLLVLCWHLQGCQEIIQDTGERRGLPYQLFSASMLYKCVW